MSDLVNVDAEGLFVGLVLQDPSLVATLTMPAEVLTFSPLARIYETLRRIWLEGDTLDVGTVRARLKSPESNRVIDKAIEKASREGGDVLALHELLLDLYRRRQTIRIADKLRNGSMTMGAALEPAVLDALDALVVTMHAERNAIPNAAEAGQQHVLALRQLRPGYNPSMPTGFPKIDGCQSVCPGQVVVVAARPSEGKSALGHQLCTAGTMSGRRGLLCSPEMSADECIERMISQAGYHAADGRAVCVAKLKNGTIDDGTWARIGNDVAGWGNLLIYDKPDMTSKDIAMVARRAHAEQPLDFLVLDYLQYIVDDDNASIPRTYQLAGIMKRLKSIARRLGIVVICLAQLNRDVEKDIDKKTGERREPLLSDLGDSGAIERDADVVIAIHHSLVVDEAAPREAALLLLKNRNGPKGRESVVWEPVFTRFVPAAGYSTREVGLNA